MPAQVVDETAPWGVRSAMGGSSCDGSMLMRARDCHFREERLPVQGEFLLEGLSRATGMTAVGARAA